MILIIIIGLIAGFFAGSLGFSAGPILVPLLLLSALSGSYKSAVGTTILTIIPPLSIFAALNYYRHGLVAIRNTTPSPSKRRVLSSKLSVLTSVCINSSVGNKCVVYVPSAYVAYNLLLVIMCLF